MRLATLFLFAFGISFFSIAGPPQARESKGNEGNVNFFASYCGLKFGEPFNKASLQGKLVSAADNEIVFTPSDYRGTTGTFFHAWIGTVKPQPIVSFPKGSNDYPNWVWGLSYVIMSYQEPTSTPKFYAKLNSEGKVKKIGIVLSYAKKDGSGTPTRDYYVLYFGIFDEEYRATFHIDDIALPVKGKLIHPTWMHEDQVLKSGDGKREIHVTCDVRDHKTTIEVDDTTVGD